MADTWKAANRDKVNAAERAARLRDPESYKARINKYLATEKAKATRRAYYLANIDTIKARAQAHALADPDRARAKGRRWYAANKTVALQRAKAHAAANPEAARSSKRNYRARANSADGFHTGDDIKVLFAKQNGRCVYCGAELGNGYHVDHIVPLSKGGSNWPDNLQLTCGPCNNHKRATDPAEFARRRLRS